jgi:hypothetical protein
MFQARTVRLMWLAPPYIREGKLGGSAWAGGVGADSAGADWAGGAG